MSNCSYGFGFGFGFGDGSGSGYGYGYGYGSGSGYGYGFGDGYGDGYGDGSGYGSGDGETIATVAGHDIRHHAPFSVVSAGCQVHTVDRWRKRWREIASRKGVEVSQEEVDAILGTIE